jgi:hypothetical protein
MSIGGSSRVVRGVRRLVIDPVIGLAGLGGFAYCFYQASQFELGFLRDSQQVHRFLFFAVMAWASLVAMAILFYVVRRWLVPQTVAVWFGCHTHTSDFRETIDRIEWTSHYQLRYMTFEKPVSGSRVDVVTCLRCGKEVRVKLWSPGSLLLLKLIAIFVIPPVLLALAATNVFVILFGFVFLIGPTAVFILHASCGTNDGVSSVSFFPTLVLDRDHKLFQEDTKTKANLKF